VKKLCTMICLFTFLMMCLISIMSVSIASAESEDNFIFSAQSNSIWVLNKSTRKMIFLQFKEPDEIWKSNQVTIPVDFNLAKCVLKAVGSRGTCVFLYDKFSGMTTFYKAKKDHSVLKYIVVNIEEDLK